MGGGTRGGVLRGLSWESDIMYETYILGTSWVFDVLENNVNIVLPVVALCWNIIMVQSLFLFVMHSSPQWI